MRRLLIAANWKMHLGRTDEALALVRERPGALDLLVTDLTMPGMTGLELVDRVRMLRDDLPIILCTGYSSSVDDSIARHIGIARLIMKPMTMDQGPRTLDRC